MGRKPSVRTVWVRDRVLHAGQAHALTTLELVDALGRSDACPCVGRAGWHLGGVSCDGLRPFSYSDVYRACRALEAAGAFERVDGADGSVLWARVWPRVDMTEFEQPRRVWRRR